MKKFHGKYTFHKHFFTRMNFDTDVSVLVIEELRYELQHSTVDVLKYLEAHPYIPPSRWAALLLWMLEMEFDVYTEIEREGGGSVQWAKRRLRPYKMFIAFHHVARHIFFLLQRGCMFDLTGVKPWKPAYKCQNMHVAAAFSILHTTLLKCIRTNKRVRLVTEAMSPAHAARWSMCASSLVAIDQ